MFTCPKCGNKLPERKLMFLTNLNAITCPTCLARVQVKNKKTSSLIGGIGGGVGAALGAVLLFYWLRTGEVFYLVFITALLFNIAFAGWWTFGILVQLEVKSQRL